MRPFAICEGIKIEYNRKSIRLKKYDYSKNGDYFITICTKNREKILSTIEIPQDTCRGRVPPLPETEYINNIPIIQTYTKISEIIKETFNNISKLDNVSIEDYIIMPDHIHFIAQLNNLDMKYCKNTTKGRGGTLPLHDIIARFKSFTTKQYNEINGTIGMKLWQRNYFEHIIRNEKEYLEILKYMQYNPLKYAIKHKLLPPLE